MLIVAYALLGHQPFRCVNRSNNSVNLGQWKLANVKDGQTCRKFANLAENIRIRRKLVLITLCRCLYILQDIS